MFNTQPNPGGEQKPTENNTKKETEEILTKLIQEGDLISKEEVIKKTEAYTRLYTNEEIKLDKKQNQFGFPGAFLKRMDKSKLNDEQSELFKTTEDIIKTSIDTVIQKKNRGRSNSFKRKKDNKNDKEDDPAKTKQKKSGTPNKTE